ncbi:vacuolar carboxypeptidase [Grosmannia clavigera kw1407]|uniref:Vacuolar carboxypeptidase n=1 Tax=Grosmannia clavigera (strain kw1407 / UAMH 11150) TaxID=655863 RepID=F0X6L3_GROCL|nr:vacuolar carboxypeptidase [Grosmannia clavigera kw1407]EFX06299.1 vacuolar carboxypeptidase [Grosmannia clavigera kw1407]
MRKASAACFLGLLGFAGLRFMWMSAKDSLPESGGPGLPDESAEWCPLPPVVAASSGDGLLPSEHLMESSQLVLQVKRLAAAVRVPTQSFDDNGDVDEDPRWATFAEFHRVLADLFPRVHARLQLRKVNRYGLLYTMPGSNTTLKPIVFMAHQDVVPADVDAPWTYPPFAGHYDGTFLWGRGAADCKNVLVGLLSVLEDLLAQSAFAPRRTIVLSFGFDEETGGQRGATELSRALEATWGADSMLLLLDEGGMGVQKESSIERSENEESERSEGKKEREEKRQILFAYPGVGEKGYLDLQLTLTVDGGHSSRPPAHSGIGMMADMIHALEQPASEQEDRPFTPRLPVTSPFRRVLECRARHAPAAVPGWLRPALLHDSEKDIAARLVAAAQQQTGEAADERWLMQTSQAVDVIAGGIKVNALPERVTAAINYRIALHEGPADVVRRAEEVLGAVAARHRLRVVNEVDLTSEGEESTRGSENSNNDDKSDSENNNDYKTSDSENSNNDKTSDIENQKYAGLLSISTSQNLPVAPLSPTGLSDGVWARFAGTLRAVFETTETGHNHTVVPVGNIMTGNTDTTHYWALTRNIYRFTPSREGTRLAAHAIDERMDMTAHLEGMRVYYNLIRNFDSWDEE